MADANRLMKFEYEGTVYEVFDRDLTLRRLRQMKSWFGRSYGAYLTFVGMVGEMDADALAGVIWVGLDKAGKQVDPRQIDYIPADLGGMQDDDEQPDEEDEPAQGESPTVASLTLTPGSEPGSSTTSEASTSSISETSSD